MVSAKETDSSDLPFAKGGTDSLWFFNHEATVFVLCKLKVIVFDNSISENSKLPHNGDGCNFMTFTLHS